MTYLEPVRKVNVFVIPASEACRESFFRGIKKDSGQAGVTKEGINEKTS
jgi:hypothetical protein